MPRVSGVRIATKQVMSTTRPQQNML
jgi:hypothetical protein